MPPFTADAQTFGTTHPFPCVHFPTIPSVAAAATHMDRDRCCWFRPSLCVLDCLFGIQVLTPVPPDTRFLATELLFLPHYQDFGQTVVDGTHVLGSSPCFPACFAACV